MPLRNKSRMRPKLNASVWQLCDKSAFGAFDAFKSELN